MDKNAKARRNQMLDAMDIDKNAIQKQALALMKGVKNATHNKLLSIVQYMFLLRDAELNHFVNIECLGEKDEVRKDAEVAVSAIRLEDFVKFFNAATKSAVSIEGMHTTLVEALKANPGRFTYKQRCRFDFVSGEVELQPRDSFYTPAVIGRVDAIKPAKAAKATDTYNGPSW